MLTAYIAKALEHASFEGPEEARIGKFRDVRDEIAKRVQALIAQTSPSAA